MNYWDHITDEKDIFGLPGWTWERGIAQSVIELQSAFTPGEGPILELGCGIGRLAIPMAEVLSTEIIGVDSSIGMLGRARPHERVTYVLGDGELLPDIPMLSGAYSMLLFQHLPPLHVLSYMRQVGKRLKSGAAFRFQFVVGEQCAERSYGYKANQMISFCTQAGLCVHESVPSSMCDEWRWITAVKPLPK